MIQIKREHMSLAQLGACIVFDRGRQEATDEVQARVKDTETATHLLQYHSNHLAEDPRDPEKLMQLIAVASALNAMSMAGDEDV